VFCTCIRTLMCTHTNTHTHTRVHAHSLSLFHTHTHTQTHAHTCTHTHTHTHTHTAHALIYAYTLYSSMWGSTNSRLLLCPLLLLKSLQHTETYTPHCNTLHTQTCVGFYNTDGGKSLSNYIRILSLQHIETHSSNGTPHVTLQQTLQQIAHRCVWGSTTV